MLVEQPFRLFNASGDLIRGDVRYFDDELPKPLVLICHGFNTNKDWGPFPYLGKKLAEAGFCTFVFNFSHNGVAEGSSVFSDYERFARNTPGRELDDVQSILDAFRSGEIGMGIADTSRIGMAGHSRGAGVSILTAASDSRIRSVVAWSTISAFLRFTDEERDQWERTGYLPLRYGASRTLLRYEVSVLRDMEKNSERYDLYNGARRLKVPTLFMHGTGDDIVSQEESRSLYEVSDKNLAEYFLVEGGGHMYGVTHPFSAATASTEIMIKKTNDWFHRTLK